MSVVMKGRTTGTYGVEIVHESGSVLRTIAPKDNGGDGSNFSPTDLCAASLGACAATIMSMFAANHGIQLHDIGFEIVKDMSPPPRKIARLTATFRLNGVASEDDFRRLVAAGKTCPVRLTLGDQVEIVEKYVRT